MIDAGKCLRSAQRHLGITSADLARLTGSTPQQLIRWRAQANMKIHTVETICKALDISIYDFLLFGNIESPN
nr:hypothetical protein [uncultured Mediterranean phage uvMED]